MGFGARAGAFHAVSKTRKNKKAEISLCDEPEFDEKKESAKISKYENVLSNSKIANKCLNYIKAKKIIYWGILILLILIFIVLIIVGVKQSNNGLQQLSCWMLVLSLLWIFPAVTATNNNVCFRVYKNKLVFVYVTSFKCVIYFNEEKLGKTSRTGNKTYKINNLKIHIYNGGFTYSISFGNEKPIRKQYGQYY